VFHIQNEFLEFLNLQTSGSDSGFMGHTLEIIIFHLINNIQLNITKKWLGFNWLCKT